MIHFKRFKQARFISCRKGSDIYKIVQHFGSFFFIHSAKRISRITCRRCVHRKAERSARRPKKFHNGNEIAVGAVRFLMIIPRMRPISRIYI